MERDIGLIPVFIDESGFLLTPSVRRTWAPRGRTPVLHHWQRHDRVSVISALTLSPRLCHRGLYVRCQADQNPEVNPDEHVWQLAKAVLANGRSEDLRRVRSSWPSWSSP